MAISYTKKTTRPYREFRRHSYVVAPFICICDTHLVALSKAGNPSIPTAAALIDLYGDVAASLFAQHWGGAGRGPALYLPWCSGIPLDSLGFRL